MEFSNWKKPSRSNGSGNCVEVGSASGLVGVRDTKNRDGGTLVVPAALWSEFIHDVKVGEYDLGA
ncbi:DUF397 domain-containing protein [Actinopolymorpha pittospori]|uniref:DUF397 domain-containing protein n=1 Tax=Actinopolymorpha pittospori TaxID=648752 RepID=A0A927RE63_9ACTN|nr:DUF397 domain-containing protein [Actinopolymorpha pittospori]MBE1613202.1 hypothetical protein [Actinopolymorpha pittospori]